jgi:hypothetical protein
MRPLGTRLLGAGVMPPTRPLIRRLTPLLRTRLRPVGTGFTIGLGLTRTMPPRIFLLTVVLPIVGGRTAMVLAVIPIVVAGRGKGAGRQQR